MCCTTEMPLDHRVAFGGEVCHGQGHGRTSGEKAQTQGAVRMTETDSAFEHSMPALYDRYMGPLLFEPYAKLVAERSALLQPKRILETAAGTGIVTRAVSQAVPQAQIVATDVNPAVLEFAAQRVGSERVVFQPADAHDLPFADESFDLVLCQFGVMFFPDKVRANREARRVLSSGARHLVVSSQSGSSSAASPSCSRSRPPLFSPLSSTLQCAARTRPRRTPRPSSSRPRTPS